MKEFALCNYHTEYSASGEGFSKRMKVEACFSDVFSKLRALNRTKKRHTMTYRILIYRGYEWGKKHHKHNACLLNHSDLRNHIDQLKGLVPFKCRIKDITSRECEKFEVIVTVINGTVRQHKYLLAWIRYSYEYPFNVTLYEARKLRNEKEFSFLSGFNLFNIVGQTLNLWEPLHSIAYESLVHLMSKEILKEKLEEDSLNLNSIFKGGNIKQPYLKESRDRKLDVRDIEFWMNDSLYREERLPIYKERLKYLRKL